MLEIQELEVAYGSITALHRISLIVAAGKIITLVGSNGAGKSTTLRAVSGLIRARTGKIIFEGEEITNRAPHRIVGLGPDSEFFHGKDYVGCCVAGPVAESMHDGYETALR